jgi:citronellol/citronellal dehydrogenase
MDAAAVELAMKKARDHFGSLDVLVNNASAISLVGSETLSVKQFDLMNQINNRGTFLCGRAAIPFLKESATRGRNPSILNLSPPLNMNPQWFAKHPAYTAAKYAMSLYVLGWAEELREHGIRANALWPRSTIATAAVKNLLGGDALVEMSRTPDIMADAAYLILSGQQTGKFEIDDAVLLRAGATAADLAKYNVVPGNDLAADFFLDDADEILAALKKGTVLPKARL